MSEPLSRIPSGTRYYFGEEARRRRSIEETALSVFDRWSYEQIVTPTVDYYSLFEHGMGQVEAHRAFRFTDTDGSLLALRPDVTSALARAAAGSRPFGKRGPVAASAAGHLRTFLLIPRSATDAP